MSKADSLSAQLGQALSDRGLRLGLAESCTGGGVAMQVTAIAGSSHWFDRGFITYSNAAKQDMLAVPTDVLAQFGAVSEQTARAMAQGVIAHSLADIALSITGIAGPGGGSDDKPVGTVWFGLATRDNICQAQCQHFSGDRRAVRQAAIEFGLYYLLSSVLDKNI